MTQGSRVWWLGVCAVAFAAGCGDDASAFSVTVTCDDVDGDCMYVEEGDDMQEALQTALLESTPGQTILIDAGHFEMGAEVSHQVTDGITIRGQGRDNTILDFSSQTSGGGILAENVSDITVEGLTILNPAADGLVVRASTGVTMRNIKVEWDPAVDESNGLYGIYPVNSDDVLVEDVISIGSSDAGIYVGESRTVVVRDCEAHHNVAGLQMENSLDSEMYDNYAHENAAGLMIFDLPGKEHQKNGGRHLAYNNVVENNNTRNFGPEGAVVSQLPSGLGTLVMAVDDVEVRDNVIRDNQTGNLAVVSFYIVDDPSSDPEYDAYPERIFVHDNEFEGGGDMPDTSSDGGQALVTLNGIANDMEDTPGVPIRDMVYDGISPPDADPDTPDATENPAYICFENNSDAEGDAGFLYLDGDNIDLETQDVSMTMPHTDITSFTCAGPTQDPVTL